MASQCPEPSRLESLIQGNLPQAEQDALAEHVDQCLHCQQTMQSLRLPGASWENLAPGLANPQPNTEPLQEALDRAKAIDSQETIAPTPAPSASTPSALGTGPSTSPREGLEFLQPPEKPGHLGRLAHYEILQVIGQGGFGTVLKAFDEKLHRMVAVKALSPAYAASGSARRRFIREARAAAAVKNEHIVAIYDVQQDAQPPYLVMELIDGISLQDKLDKHGPLGVKEILRIGMQAAEGLAAAHKQGLVHRDIKPANILLENGVERVKITDFGLARAVDDASMTQSGTVAGTPMYMSPEQAAGEQIDHRSDLFSLGTVLYSMCTGHPPFRATGTHAVLMRVIEDTPRPIRDINNEIPEWLEAIVAKLHAKKRDERFQTAKEVAELLGQHLAHLQQPASVPAPAPIKVPAQSTRETRLENLLEQRETASHLLQHIGLVASGAMLVVGVALIAFNPAVRWVGFVLLIGGPMLGLGLSLIKQRWFVRYRGHLVRLENGPGGASLFIDDVSVARCGAGLHKELRATIPNSEAAGEEVVAIADSGLMGVRCRITVERPPPPAAAPRPAPVVVPINDQLGMRTAAKGAWLQIFEGTDYRGRLLQYGIVIFAFVPVYIFVAVAAAGWLDSRRNVYLLAGVMGWGVLHVVWSVACLWLLARTKHRWEVAYKGRTLRLELSSFGGESLYLDGQRLIKCGWGFSFKELQAAIPSGTGAGDRIRVLGQFGFLTPTCRIYASEGAPAAGGSVNGWAKLLGSLRPLVYVSTIAVPIALFAWLLLCQGWVSVKVDDPEMLVMLDGEIYVSGDRVDPNSWHIRGGSLRTGEHFLRAIRGGKVVFEERFHLGFGENRDFDLTRSALQARRGSTTAPAGQAPGPPALAGSPFNAEKATSLQQAWAKHLGVDIETTNSIGMKLRLIPPGEFAMAPKYRARITKPYRVGIHKVTVGQYRQFVKETGYKTFAEASAQGAVDKDSKKDPKNVWDNPRFAPSDECPVGCLDWNDAAKFCEWLSKKENKTYRLPTEAEWEWACRAGSMTAYFWGNDDKPYSDYDWPHMSSHPVGGKAPNPWGLFDLYGMTTEFCLDFDANYPEGTVEDPRGPAIAAMHVIRGVNSSARFQAGAGHSFFHFGLRVVCEDASPTYKNDKERLQGYWIAESIDNGRQLPKEVVDKFTIKTTGNKMIMTTPLPDGWESLFHLDENATPKKIDIIGSDRKAQFGIYCFDGDRLVLCIGEDDEKDRPTEFSPKGGNGRMVVVLKKAPMPPSYKDDADRLQGEWTGESMEVGGMKATPAMVAKLRMAFTGKRLHITIPSPVPKLVKDEEDQGDFFLDETKNPKWITVTSANDRLTRYGIYKFDGDRLMLSFGEDFERNRPTEFSTKGDLKRGLMVFRRAGVTEPGWISLFNGKDLSGWVPQLTDKNENPFHAIDTLRILAANGPRGGYLRTDKQYADFILEFECKSQQNRDVARDELSGALFLEMSQPDATTGGYRIALVPGGQGALEKVGESKNQSPAQLVDWRAWTFELQFPPEVWNHVQLESRQGKLEFTLNGRGVFSSANHPSRKGFLGIEAIGAGLYYRNIRIKELPPQPRPLPKKAADIRAFIAGTWRIDSVIVAPKVPPEYAKMSGFNVFEPICGGKFLRTYSNYANGRFESLMVQRYDEAADSVKGWFFSSQGDNHGPGVGRWNADTRTMLWVEKLPSGLHATYSFEFADANTIKTRVYNTNDKNDVVFELKATGTRLPGAVDLKPAPIDPKRLQEMKFLDQFLGDWQTTGTVKSDDFAGRKFATKLSARSTLGGRMIETKETGLPGHEDLYWLMTYDTNLAAYRMWLFNGAGDVTSLGGGWDDKTGTMKWNEARPDGSIAASTWKRINADCWEWTTLIRDAVGKTLFDVRATKTRVKAAAAPPALPQQPADVLPFFVGPWKADGEVIEPAPPGGLETRATASETFDFVSAGKFLRSFKTNTKGLFDTLTLQSWDANAQTFTLWHFDTNGEMRDPVKGSWDADKRALTFKAPSAPNIMLPTSIHSLMAAPSRFTISFATQTTKSRSRAARL
jgi:uncharacterized protein (TIGR03067 family)